MSIHYLNTLDPDRFDAGVRRRLLPRNPDWFSYFTMIAFVVHTRASARSTPK
jgi:hypothetical protein